jgi:hypothetical protein
VPASPFSDSAYRSRRFVHSGVLAVLTQASVEVTTVSIACSDLPQSSSESGVDYQVSGWTREPPAAANGPFIQVSSEESSITIEQSQFTGFGVLVMSFTFSGWVKLSSVTIEKRSANSYPYYAITTQKITELLLVDVSFKDFSACNVVYSLETPEKSLLSLYDIQFINVSGLTSDGLVLSVFKEVYGDSVSFINCSSNTPIMLSGANPSDPSPVLHGLLVDHWSGLPDTEGVLLLDVPYGCYFIVEAGRFVCAQSKCSAAMTVYFESCSFEGHADFTLDGAAIHGPYSVIACTFKGFVTAFHSRESSLHNLICRSNFTDCSTCIYCSIQIGMIIGCLFQTYTVVGVHMINDMRDNFYIKDCVFIGAGFPAIWMGGELDVNGTCFTGSGQDRLIAKSPTVSGSPTLILGSGNCDPAADSATAIQDINTIQLTNPEEPPYACTCSLASLNQSPDKCIGQGFPPRPTPRASHQYLSPHAPSRLLRLTSTSQRQQRRSPPR